MERFILLYFKSKSGWGRIKKIKKSFLKCPLYCSEYYCALFQTWRIWTLFACTFRREKKKICNGFFIKIRVQVYGDGWLTCIPWLIDRSDAQNTLLQAKEEKTLFSLYTHQSTFSYLESAKKVEIAQSFPFPLRNKPSTYHSDLPNKSKIRCNTSGSMTHIILCYQTR